MCGRYTLRATPAQLAEIFETLRTAEVRPRFNVLPGTTSLVVRNTPDAPEAATPKWGFVPRFAKDPKKGYKPVNARAETVATSPMFRLSFRDRRCLIVCDGFYEPEEDEKDKKTGEWYYFRYEDDRPFCFAGLWDRCGEGDAALETFVLITTEPNDLTAAIGHKRSPVIVPPERYDLWLDPKASPAQLKALFPPYSPEDMVFYLTNGRAKSPKAEGPDLIEPAGPVRRA
ncbi:MAG TPA: SOS response-associated peptidase [Planctomycetaceae bacterium]